MIPFNIDGQKVKIPSSYNDFTVGMMQDAMHQAKTNPEKWKNILFRISTYTGMDYSRLENCKMSDEAFELLVATLEFEREPMDVEAINSIIPNTIHFYNEDGTIKETHRVPRNIDQERTGPKVMFMQKIAPEVYPKDAEPGTILPVLDLAIAIYFQATVMPGPDSKRPFDTDKVFEFAEHCKRCKFTEALPVATFFLIKYLNLTKKK